MLPLGISAPDFSSPDAEGNIVSLTDFKDAPALLVIFMCNHCPFVKHILTDLVRLIGEYQKKNVAFVGINSNDFIEFPEDNPEMMAKLQEQAGFTFPYLIDQTQVIYIAGFCYIFLIAVVYIVLSSLMYFLS
jgi:peroxiredoxin